MQHDNNVSTKTELEKLCIVQGLDSLVESINKLQLDRESILVVSDDPEGFFNDCGITADDEKIKWKKLFRLLHLEKLCIAQGLDSLVESIKNLHLDRESILIVSEDPEGFFNDCEITADDEKIKWEKLFALLQLETDKGKGKASAAATSTPREEAPSTRLVTADISVQPKANGNASALKTIDHKKIDELPNQDTSANLNAAKNTLQQMCARRKLNLPNYEHKIIGGSKHQPLWLSTLTILDKAEECVVTTQAISTNKVYADKSVALLGIEKLNALKAPAQQLKDRKSEVLSIPPTLTTTTTTAQLLPQINTPDSTKTLAPVTQHLNGNLDATISLPKEALEKTVEQPPSESYQPVSNQQTMLSSDSLLQNSQPPLFPTPPQEAQSVNNLYKKPQQPAATVLVHVETVTDATSKAYRPNLQVMAFLGEKNQYAINDGEPIARIMEPCIIKSNKRDAANHFLTFTAGRLAQKMDPNRTKEREYDIHAIPAALAKPNEAQKTITANKRIRGAVISPIEQQQQDQIKPYPFEFYIISRDHAGDNTAACLRQAGFTATHFPAVPTFIAADPIADLNRDASEMLPAPAIKAEEPSQYQQIANDAETYNLQSPHSNNYYTAPKKPSAILLIDIESVPLSINESFDSEHHVIGFLAKNHQYSQNNGSTIKQKKNMELKIIDSSGRDGADYFLTFEAGRIAEALNPLGNATELPKIYIISRDHAGHNTVDCLKQAGFDAEHRENVPDKFVSDRIPNKKNKAPQAQPSTKMNTDAQAFVPKSDITLHSIFPTQDPLLPRQPTTRDPKNPWGGATSNNPRAG